MLCSSENRYIYVAVPRTGTTSIEAMLIKRDPNLRRNRLPAGNMSFKKVNKHISTQEIIEELGEKQYGLKYFAFVRDPADYAISKYFYYLTGRGRKRYTEGKTGAPDLWLKVWLVRVLPAVVWFAIYPWRSQVSFLQTSSGEIDLAMIGRFDRFDKDFERMAVRIGYTHSADRHLHVNAAPRIIFSPLKRKIIEAIIRIRLSDDMALYNVL